MATNSIDHEVKLQCLVIPQGKSVRHKPSKEFTILPVDILLITFSTDPEAYAKIRLLKKRRLVPVEYVGEIFPQENPAAPKHVHILVELPDDESSDDSLEEQKKSQTITNEKIRVSTACIYTTTETSAVIDPLLRQELGHVMHRNVDKFFDLLFPMTEEHRCVVDGILEECKQEGKWRDKWVDLPTDGSKEKDFYSPFASTTNFIIQRCNKILPVRFIVHASCCPLLGRRGAIKRKPDIVLVNENHIIRKGSNDVIYWRNIHLIGEIKRTYQKDNAATDLELACYVRELFGNQHNRRFVLGFTLCGDLMRVWLFDRSGCISSNTIAIHHDPAMFIRVIAGFATMGLSQLGYDTTIMDMPLRLGCIDIEKCDEQEPKNKKTERFVLIETIFHRAVISGRGTICWRAYRLDENGEELRTKEFIIKDSWRPISRKNTEGDLLERATNALKYIPNARIVKYYHHEDVTLKEDGSQEKIVDDTFVCIRKQLHLPLDEIPSNNKTAARENSSSEYHISDCSSGGSKSSGSFKGQNFQLKEPEYRVHTRLITSTSGKPIYCFDDQIELLTAFYDVIEGHRNLLRIANILHGDISLYNLMIGADGRGFIIDLDYAIDLGFDQSLITEYDQKKDAQCHRTGTLPFMAIEILNHNAEHTFQHDLESFFYVLCWICCEYEGPRGKLRANNCGRKDLMKWVEGSPETISILKSGMMLDFKRNVLETFSPYFDNLTEFMVKFYKMMFKTGRLRVDVSYEPILKLFDNEIQQRKDENLTSAIGNLNI